MALPRTEKPADWDSAALHRAAANAVHIEIVILFYEQHISLSLSIHTASLSNKTFLDPVSVRGNTNRFPGW